MDEGEANVDYEAYQVDETLTFGTAVHIDENDVPFPLHMPDVQEVIIASPPVQKRSDDFIDNFREDVNSNNDIEQEFDSSNNNTNEDINSNTDTSDYGH